MVEYIRQFSLFFVTLLIFIPAANLYAQDSTAVPEEAPNALIRSDSTSSIFSTTKPGLIPTLKPVLSESFSPKFKQTLKYDTTWDNPETRCYEFKQPISRNYLFLFKFLSKQQYEVYSLP